MSRITHVVEKGTKNINNDSHGVLAYIIFLCIIYARASMFGEVYIFIKTLYLEQVVSSET
jgi:hypothetical protein